MSHAAHVFKLSARQGDGATLRAHLEKGAKAGRQDLAAELQGPPLPAGFAYLWRWFQELHTRRTAGMHGPAPITWQDLVAWSQLTGAEPSPWDCDVLMLLDNAFFASVTPTKPAKAAVA